MYNPNIIILKEGTKNYTLLQDLNATYMPYIVVYGYNQGSWTQGHYFTNKQDALSYMEV